MKNEHELSGKSPNSHPDPITGTPGAHPVGTGLGAAGAGAVGAVIGAAAGPVGIVAGTAIGAVVGGLAGKTVAESIDPTSEDGYWQHEHDKQVYATYGSYERYKAAYRTGYEGVARHGLDRGYDDVENDLQTAYERANEDRSGVIWDHARHAARAAYERARNGLKK